MGFICSLLYELIGNGRILNFNWSWWDNFGVDGEEDDDGFIILWNKFCIDSIIENVVGGEFSCSIRRRNFSSIWSDDAQELWSRMISIRKKNASEFLRTDHTWAWLMINTWNKNILTSKLNKTKINSFFFFANHLLFVVFVPKPTYKLIIDHH